MTQSDDIAKRDQTDSTDIANEFPQLHASAPQAEVASAVTLLGETIKNGMFYQAAELTDQLIFFCGDFLCMKADGEDALNLDRKIKLERLKRMSYLLFKSGERYCRDSLCEELKLDTPKSDSEYFNLFTIIGIPLWREDTKEAFDAGFEKCVVLESQVSDDYKHKRILTGFLHGLRGRKAAWNKESPEIIVGHFNNGLKVIPQDESHRSRLHLIVYCLEILYEIANTSSAGGNDRQTALRLFDEKLVDFYRIRISHENTIFTLLTLHALLLNTKRHELELRAIEDNDKKLLIEKHLSNVKNDLWLETHRAGLSAGKPFPPLLADIDKVLAEQNELYDSEQRKAWIQKWLNRIDGYAMERVAKVYLEGCGFKDVTMQFDCYPAIDLIVKQMDPLGSIICTAVQVKHWEEPFRESNYRDWILKLSNISPEKRKEITHVQFFLKKEPHVDNAEKMENLLRGMLPSFKTEIKYVIVNEVAEWLQKHSSSLPKIFSAVSVG